MTLDGGDITAIITVVGFMVAPLYGLFGFLMRAVYNLNREVGQLKNKIQPKEK